MGLECQNCGHALTEAEILSEAARINGRKKSEAKANAARENGNKGGRPRKHNVTGEPSREKA